MTTENTEDDQDTEMRWCYSESTPYSLEGLGDEAWLTGCPLCGCDCYQRATPEQQAEAEEYYSENK